MNVQLTDFCEYRERLLQLARLYTRKKTGDKWQFDRDLAEDVVQDVYIAFHKIVVGNKIEFESKQHLEAILKKKVWQVSMSSKLNNKGVKYKGKESYMDIIPERLEPFIEAGAIEELDHIYTTIHSLHYKRDVDILLYYIEGYDCPELAEMFKTTKSGIKGSLYRCREQLRKKLNIKKYFCCSRKSNKTIYA